MDQVQRPSNCAAHYRQNPLEFESTEGVYYTVTAVYYFVLFKLGVGMLAKVTYMWK
jgi:hypothetical protein